MINKIRLTSLILCALLFSSCDMILDNHYEDLAKGHHIYYTDYPPMRTLWDVVYWVESQVEYKSDGTGDVWQEPEITLTTGQGDCEDIAIAIMNVAYCTLYAKMDLALIDTNNRMIVEGGWINHAAVSFEGKLYVPEYLYYSPIKFLYRFNLVFIQ